MPYLCAVAIALLCAVSPAAAGLAVQGGPNLSIRIHDYAHIDDESWERTEEQVSDTYARAGVRVEWRQVTRPADVQAGLVRSPTDPLSAITVIVLSQEMSGPQDMPMDVAGYAPISREHGGRTAFVFAARTLRIAREAGVIHERVLSAVIAHEIAHLLMPQRSHSTDGLMRGHWLPDQFGYLWQQRFSPEDARAIREMARLRTGDAGRIAD